MSYLDFVEVVELGQSEAIQASVVVANLDNQVVERFQVEEV